MSSLLPPSPSVCAAKKALFPPILSLANSSSREQKKMKTGEGPAVNRKAGAAPAGKGKPRLSGTVDHMKFLHSFSSQSWGGVVGWVRRQVHSRPYFGIPCSFPSFPCRPPSLPPTPNPSQFVVAFSSSSFHSYPQRPSPSLPPPFLPSICSPVERESAARRRPQRRPRSVGWVISSSSVNFLSTPLTPSGLRSSRQQQFDRKEGTKTATEFATANNKRENVVMQLEILVRLQ